MFEKGLCTLVLRNLKTLPLFLVGSLAGALHSVAVEQIGAKSPHFYHLLDALVLFFMDNYIKLKSLRQYESFHRHNILFGNSSYLWPIGDRPIVFLIVNKLERDKECNSQNFEWLAPSQPKTRIKHAFYKDKTRDKHLFFELRIIEELLHIPWNVYSCLPPTIKKLWKL